MKKLALTLLIILAISFVYAQESQNKTIAETAKSFQETSNAFLEKDITIPSELDIFAKILFGINESATIEFSSLIILAALWIILLLLIQAIMEIIPLFGEGWKSWIAAVIVTSLASISGVIKDAAVFLFDLKRLFGWLGNYSFFFIVLNIIILIILAWGAKMLLHKLKQELKKAAAEMRGLKS